MSEELKPCPFCGHKTIQESFFDLPCKVYRIRCPRCYIFMDNTSENMVMKAWNFRPIEDELRKQLDEANKRIAELEDIDLYVVYKKGLEDGTRKIWHSPKEVPDNGYAQCLYVCADGYCNILNSETMRAEHGKDFLSDLIKWAYVKDLKAMK